MNAKLAFRSVARSHVGLVRPINEDAFVAQDGGLWAVADGVGGQAAGEVASGVIANCLGAARLDPAVRDLEASVRRSLQEAHQEILRGNVESEWKTEMASTVAVLCMEGTRYFCLWAGDSRIYRLRQHELTQLTKDHRLVQDMLDAGLIVESEAVLHPNRNVLTRAIGSDAAFQIDGSAGDLRAGDRFLLATDGVTEVCNDSDIVTVLDNVDLTVSADALVELCLSRGGPDNLTFVLVLVTQLLAE